MAWARLLLAAIQITQWIAKEVERREVIDATIAKRMVRVMELSNARVQKALGARRSVDHGRLPDDDRYRRD